VGARKSVHVADLLILMDEAVAAVASSELVGLGPSAVGKRA
jgi:hypothetical protein